MTHSITIALAQVNPTVGDIDGNAKKLDEARQEAENQGADLVVAGELALAGYPPEDLVLKPAFQQKISEAIDGLAKTTAHGGPGVLVGAPWVEDGKLYNAAVLLDGGEVKSIRYKHALPNYGVFDEKRVFAPGPLSGPVNFRGIRLGIMICEDMWVSEVAECLSETGAELLIVMNGSPFEMDKTDERLSYAVARVTETDLPLIYVNLVGGQDELVFDGGSFALASDRSLAAKQVMWREQVLPIFWRRSNAGWAALPAPITPEPDEDCKIYQAMVLGLRDYVDKNRFPGVILGMSGGIDSALSAAVAVDALGADRVHLVMMASPYTSNESLEDAAKCAEMLAAKLDHMDIAPAMETFSEMLAPHFAGHEQGVSEENIQSRIRGLLLMALSNKLGHMVLTTGNKSEMSVGYATLYGDMCGGYSVLKDVYKSKVFQLAKWRNENRPENSLGPDGSVMPDRVISKPPSAELKPDQTDQDSLPPYDVLDAILQDLIEGEKSLADMVAAGHDKTITQRIWKMLDTAEYKRRQAPPGVKITRRAFGRDRRYPITNGFTDQI